MPTIRSRTCPTCDKPIGPKGWATQAASDPPRSCPSDPTNFADRQLGPQRSPLPTDRDDV